MYDVREDKETCLGGPDALRRLRRLQEGVPPKAITIYKGLYAKVEETLCIGCKKCAKECPASIIDLREVDR